MSAAYQEGTWKDPASHASLFYRVWVPASSRALLILVHGFGEHGGRYKPLAEVLAASGLSVAVPDLCSHGWSSGSRGDIADVHGCIKLLRQLTQERFLPLAKQQQYTLYGHSFGSMVAMRWAMDNPAELQRMIVQSPLLKLAFPIPAWKEFLGSTMATLNPELALSMNLDASALTHDAEIVSAYQKDALVHNRMSARCYRSILQTRDVILANPASITVPTLLMLGEEDRIVSVDTARSWFEKLNCPKRLVVFPGAYHELHHEPVRAEIIKEILFWMN